MYYERKVGHKNRYIDCDLIGNNFFQKIGKLEVQMKSEIQRGKLGMCLL